MKRVTADTEALQPTGEYVQKSKLELTRREVLGLLGAAAGARVIPSWAAGSDSVAPQPYFAGLNRAIDALGKLGAPLAAAHLQEIALLTRQNDPAAVAAAEKLLDQYTLASVSIDSAETAHVVLGGAPKALVEQGWRMFLVRVANPTGRSDNINFSTGWYASTPGRMSPNTDSNAQRAYLMDTLNKAPLIEKMGFLSQLHDATSIVRYGIEIPVVPLSGLPVEYQIIQLFSRDHGRHGTELALMTFPKFGGDGASASKKFDFECLPSRDVVLGVHDMDGRGCVASLTIKDKSDRVYPPQVMRIAPDMAFHSHIYRADGETVRLPVGEYTIESKRGPEYLRDVQTVTIDEGLTRIQVNLKRWIDPGKWGWYSGDTHIHAAGCAHYAVPTEGVSPETMIRHVRGEALSIAEVLIWTGGYYYQKQFFTGSAESPAAVLEHPELQAANNATWQPRPTPEDTESLLRYDVEVSGFPSSLSGHLVLLRLKDENFPGAKVIEDWPSWTLPILKWAKAQGAVAGFAHCGLGMEVDSTELPNYEIPPFDSIGTNEAIIDATHDVVDFLSGCNTVPAAELNAWYHMLNCGFRMSLVGETDYPCISDERPGQGRSYVRLDSRPLNDAGYDAWIQGLQKGRLYCGDGRSHFLEFKVNGRSSGDEDLRLGRTERVAIEALVAARLEPDVTSDAVPKRTPPTWGWHLEWARIEKTREVPVELIVNGIAVEKVSLVADGKPRSIKFKTLISRSSWLALRILPSAHTHPVFVLVGNKPIRASKRSAEWCRACVDKVWVVKSPFMRESDRLVAAEAFDHARRTYDTISGECEIV